MNKKTKSTLIIAISLLLIAACAVAVVVFKKHSDNKEKNTGAVMTSYAPEESLSDKMLTQLFEEETQTDVSVEAVQPKEFKMFSPESTSFSTTSPTVSFEGEYDTAYPLYVNGVEKKGDENGLFSLNSRLKAGENTFVFKTKGKEYTYKITYNVLLIKSVTPAGSAQYPAGSTVVFTVSALKSSTVYAEINGEKITLKEGSPSRNNEGKVIDENFSDYSGEYTLPSGVPSDTNIGRVVFHVSNAGNSETKNGAAISVTAVHKFVPPEKKVTATTTTPTRPTTAPTTQKPIEKPTEEPGTIITDPPTGEPSTKPTTKPTTVTTTQSKPFKGFLDPYTNHGYKTNAMCEILLDHIETYSAKNKINFKSDPTATPLLKGTYDYVESTVTQDGVKYYLLSSGVYVESCDAKFIKNGYVMPWNELKLKSVGKDDYGIKFSLYSDWKVPFQVSFAGQTNYPSLNSRYSDETTVRFGISEFKASYVDITFFHTNKPLGSVDVSKSNVVEKAEWKEGSDSCTLHLKLKTAGRFYGYCAEWNDNEGCITFKIKDRQSSLSGACILLDPGHGTIGTPSNDYGAEYDHGVTPTEAELALQIAKKLETVLLERGAKKVTLTHSDIPTKVYIENRVNTIREGKHDIFVSIHLNSYLYDRTSRGTEGYYHYINSQPLAKCITDSLVKVYNNKLYSAESDVFKGETNRGTKYGAYGVIRVEECPAVLMETGFITNLKEFNIMKDEKNQKLIAIAYADGIENYFKKY